MLTVVIKHDDQLHKLPAQMPPPAFHTAQTRISSESLDWNLSQGVLLFLLTSATSAFAPAWFCACSHCQWYPSTACKAALILLGGPNWQPGPAEPGRHLWREPDFGITYPLELFFSTGWCNKAPNVCSSDRLRHSLKLVLGSKLSQNLLFRLWLDFDPVFLRYLSDRQELGGFTNLQPQKTVHLYLKGSHDERITEKTFLFLNPPTFPQAAKG